MQDFVALQGGRIVKTFVEVESGKNNDRVELAEAMSHAASTNSTLIIATLDRLSRDAAFLLRIKDAGVRITTCDGVAENGDVLAWGVRAIMAQSEREKISERTRRALQVLKDNKVKLGNPNGAAALHRAGKKNTDAIAAVKAQADAYAYRLRRTIRDYKASGATSLRQIAARLTEDGFEPPRGGKWGPSNVRNILARLETVA